MPDPRPEYTADELRRWWPAVCPACGWRGLSRDCAGGQPIADTGDYGDVLCPTCLEAGRTIEVDCYDTPEPPKGGK